MAVGLRTEDQTSAVRSFALKSLEPEAICESALNALKSFNCGQGDLWLVQHSVTFELNFCSLSYFMENFFANLLLMFLDLLQEARSDVFVIECK